MNNEEANRRLFALAHPGECWHESDNEEYATVICRKCGSRFGGGAWRNAHPDYFNSHLPDSERVRLVTAAVEKYGAEETRSALMNYPTLAATLTVVALMQMSAPQIAAAIDELEQKQNAENE